MTQSPQLNQPNETPKEVNSPGFDLDSIPKPELSGHAWRQQGTQLICQSCPFTHMSFIPTDYQLYGIDDKGFPMIRKITVKS